MLIVSAPVRIDISAGWSDADPFRSDFGGSVLNAAINLRVEGRLNHKDLVSSLNKVPSNSGLGTSGALRTVYLVAANPELINDKNRLIKRVHVFENAIVGQRAGFQDQAAAIFGGVNYWEFRKDGSIWRETVSNGKAKHLYDRLVLVFTGERHLSSNVHTSVFENTKRYMKKIPTIERISLIAKEMYKHISNEKKMAELMNETWMLQKSLHRSVESPAMKKIQRICNGNYLAARATGAGGGGCMIFYTDNKRKLESVLHMAERKVKGMKVLPFKFDYRGIELKRK